MFNRNKDYGYFCREALSFHSASIHPVWLVSDCRRPTDHRFFEEQFPSRCRRVRVYASEEARRTRGWVFQANVDDAESECGLDGAAAHVTIHNDSKEEAEELLRSVVEEVLKLAGT